MNRRLPVTLIGGFLGAGKTSLLHHFISEHRGGHLAVLVENRGALNLDAKAIRGLCGAMRRTSDSVLEIPPGDEAEQAEWMAAQLRDWSPAGRYERVLIEVDGAANAARLARHFGLLPGQSEKLAPWAELHQIVCVVDALDFYRTGRSPASEAAFWDFQNEQIAGASLVILNKCDLLEEKELELCTRALRSLHPGVPMIETAYGEVPPQVWARPATLQELDMATERRFMSPATNGEEARVTPPQPSLTNLLYRAYRPFHPERFSAWFNADHPGLLRVKGLVWLATRNLLVGGISRTRRQNSCGAAGIWWAALPREEWPEDPEALLRMQETWREPYGDRRQELVLIGDAAQLSAVTGQLNACLLNAGEYARPVQDWSALPDPFPAWDLEEG